VATRADAVELRQGCARWMRVAHVVITLLAAGAVLSSGAPLPGQAMLLAALLAVHLATARRMRQAAGDVPRIRVSADGTASLLLDSGAVPAVLGGPAWTTRWFSVFPLRRLDGGRPLHCTVCRSANPGGAYRRLRVLLRLRSVPASGTRQGWL